VVCSTLAGAIDRGYQIGGSMAADDDIDDATLVRELEACTLPFARWTHRMHVRYAFSCLARAPFEEALARVRSGIQRYNAANARPGYHETMTVAWLRLVASAMRHVGPVEESRAFCAAAPHLLSSWAPLFFYTRSRLLSPEARDAFVEPDIAPLPR
jgi:hypothetical protein